MTDKELEPFIAVVLNEQRNEDLRSQEITTITEVVKSLLPFLESGYALDKWVFDHKEARVRRASRQHVQGVLYEADTAYGTADVIIRNDGALFTKCRTFPWFAIDFVTELHPWPNDRVPAAEVLKKLLDWRTRVERRAWELKDDFERREARVQQTMRELST